MSPPVRPTSAADVAAQLTRPPSMVVLVHNTIAQLVTMYGNLITALERENEQLRVENAALRVRISQPDL